MFFIIVIFNHVNVLTGIFLFIFDTCQYSTNICILNDHNANSIKIWNVNPKILVIWIYTVCIFRFPWLLRKRLRFTINKELHVNWFIMPYGLVVLTGGKCFGWIWPPYRDTMIVTAIIKDAKKCQPATRRRAPVWVISMYDTWNVSSMFVYKEGRRRNIWHLCTERCVMIFPTLMPVHSEHGILLARLQWDSPANTASFFFSSIFLFVGSVDAREIRCSHGRKPLGQMTDKKKNPNNYIIAVDVKFELRCCTCAFWFLCF